MSKNTDLISKQIRELEAAQVPMMKKIGEVARIFFIDTFNKKGFTDKNFEAWEKDENPSNELLVRTGDLKRSIRVSEISEKKVTISSDIAYATFINDGTSRMPARKFMGDSALLSTMVEKEIDNTIKKIFKK